MATLQRRGLREFETTFHPTESSYGSPNERAVTIARTEQAAKRDRRGAYSLLLDVSVWRRGSAFAE
jgi:hypothetical protein